MNSGPQALSMGAPEISMPATCSSAQTRRYILWWAPEMRTDGRMVTLTMKGLPVSVRTSRMAARKVSSVS